MSVNDFVCLWCGDIYTADALPIDMLGMCVEPDFNRDCMEQFRRVYGFTLRKDIDSRAVLHEAENIWTDRVLGA